MTDEINEKLPPECGQCADYIEVQKIKTKRIKELNNKLDIAIKALKEIVRMNGIMGCETVDETRQALNEIKPSNEG